MVELNFFKPNHDRPETLEIISMQFDFINLYCGSRYSIFIIFATFEKCYRKLHVPVN